MTAVGMLGASSRRTQMLRALGTVPYVLRQASKAPVADQLPSAVGVGAGCVLVLPADCAPRLLALVERATASAGFAGAAQVQVVDGAVQGEAPVAPAYLAFGQAQAQALGRSLPAAVTMAAQVVLLDVPEKLLAGAGKRNLWIALGALRRTLRARGS